MIRINGMERNMEQKILADFLMEEGYDFSRIAVERNGEIVPKVQYSATVLQDGDVIEIVRFVGGG